MSNAKVYFPTLPLQEAVARGGGLTRENAIEAALENVGAISGEGNQTIEASISALEALVAQGRAGLAPEKLREILAQADQIVTLAGTFGYTALDSATRGLCDVADGLLQAGIGDLAPVAVHVRAVRLFSPFSNPPSAEESSRILGELAKVSDHYGFAALGKGA
jgi:hypothetical protein